MGAVSLHGCGFIFIQHAAGNVFLVNRSRPRAAARRGERLGSVSCPEAYSWAGGGCTFDGGEGGDGDAGGGVWAEGGVAGVQGGAGRKRVVHEEDVPSMGQGLLGRFPVKPGMTEGIKQGMTEDIRPEVTEGAKQGMGCLVMLRLGRGVPAGGGEGDLKGGGDVAGFLLDGEFGLGAGASGPHKNIRTALDRGMKILSSTSGLLRMTKTQHLRSRMTGTNTFGIFRMTTPNSFVIFRMTTTNASAILRMTERNNFGPFRRIATNTSGPFRMTGTSTFGSLRMIKGIADCLGEDFGLVIAAGAEAGPMKGDGDDEVHVGKVGRRSEVTAQQTAVEAAGGEVGVVFQGTWDGTVGALVVHEGGGIGIVHAFVGGPVPLEDGVEAVGQGVMGR